MTNILTSLGGALTGEVEEETLVEHAICFTDDRTPLRVWSSFIQIMKSQFFSLKS